MFLNCEVKQNLLARNRCANYFNHFKINLQLSKVPKFMHLAM